MRDSNQHAVQMTFYNVLSSLTHVYAISDVMCVQYYCSLHQGPEGISAVKKEDHLLSAHIFQDFPSDAQRTNSARSLHYCLFNFLRVKFLNPLN